MKWQLSWRGGGLKDPHSTCSSTRKTEKGSHICKPDKAGHRWFGFRPVEQDWPRFELCMGRLNVLKLTDQSTLVQPSCVDFSCGYCQQLLPLAIITVCSPSRDGSLSTRRTTAPWEVFLHQQWLCWWVGGIEWSDHLWHFKSALFP